MEARCCCCCCCSNPVPKRGVSTKQSFHESIWIDDESLPRYEDLASQVPVDTYADFPPSSMILYRIRSRIVFFCSDRRSRDQTHVQCRKMLLASDAIYLTGFLGCSCHRMHDFCVLARIAAYERLSQATPVEVARGLGARKQRPWAPPSASIPR